MHMVAPFVHAFVQHDAAPAAPVQAPLLHVIADASNKQPLLSCWQLATAEDDCPHTGPIALHTASATHVQAPVPADPVQVWRVGQTRAAPHRPLAPHVSSAAPEHRVAPGWQGGAEPFPSFFSPAPAAPSVSVPPVPAPPPPSVFNVADPQLEAIRTATTAVPLSRPRESQLPFPQSTILRL
jgi:hypothetical protein